MATDEKERAADAVTTTNALNLLQECNDELQRDRFSTIALCAKTVEKDMMLSYIIRDNHTKRQFGNQFETNQLKSMGLHQSVDQIAQLIKTAQNQSSGAKLSFEIGFSQSNSTKHSKVNSNKSNSNDIDNGYGLSMKYNTGDSLFVIVSIAEVWFNGVFVFELKEQS